MVFSKSLRRKTLKRKTLKRKTLKRKSRKTYKGGAAISYTHPYYDTAEHIYRLLNIKLGHGSILDESEKQKISNLATAMTATQHTKLTQILSNQNIRLKIDQVNEYIKANTNLSEIMNLK
jgi:hypothetical protein